MKRGNSKGGDPIRLETPVKAYELKPDCYYLFEVKDTDVARDTLTDIASLFAQSNIYITFVITSGNEWSIRAIPPVERTKIHETK